MEMATSNNNWYLCIISAKNHLSQKLASSMSLQMFRNGNYFQCLALSINSYCCCYVHLFSHLSTGIWLRETVWSAWYRLHTFQAICLQYSESIHKSTILISTPVQLGRPLNCRTIVNFKHKSSRFNRSWYTKIRRFVRYWKSPLWPL